MNQLQQADVVAIQTGNVRRYICPESEPITLSDILWTDVFDRGAYLLSAGTMAEVFMTQNEPNDAKTNAHAEQTATSDFSLGARSPIYWTVFIFSLAPILVCVAMWILILVQSNTHTYGGPDLGGLVIFFLLIGIGVAHAVSSVFSIIGLCYVRFAERRFGRAFGWLLAVNFAMVAIPVLGFITHNWYKQSISLINAVESGDTHRLEALLATRQRSPHPDEAQLAMTAAVEAGNIEMVDMLVRAYREKWSENTEYVNTYEAVLILAVAKNKVDLIRMLLERGVDPNKPRFGIHKEKSLLDAAEAEAKKTNDWRIVRLLRSHGAK